MYINTLTAAGPVSEFLFLRNRFQRMTLQRVQRMRKCRLTISLEKLPSQQFGQPVVATSLTSHTHKTCSGLPRLPSRRSLNSPHADAGSDCQGHRRACDVGLSGSTVYVLNDVIFAEILAALDLDHHQADIAGVSASVCGHKGYRWIDWWPGVAPGRR